MQTFVFLRGAGPRFLSPGVSPFRVERLSISPLTRSPPFRRRFSSFFYPRSFYADKLDVAELSGLGATPQFKLTPSGAPPPDMRTCVVAALSRISNIVRLATKVSFFSASPPWLDTSFSRHDPTTPSTAASFAS